MFGFFTLNYYTLKNTTLPLFYLTFHKYKYKGILNLRIIYLSKALLAKRFVLTFKNSKFNILFSQE